MVFSIIPLPPFPSDLDPSLTSLSHPDSGGHINIDIDIDIHDDVDVETEIPTRSSQRTNTAIVTPGETVTEDPQWMRCGSRLPRTPTTLSNQSPAHLLMHAYHAYHPTKLIFPST